MAITGKLNTVPMPDLGCSPKDSLWTNLANFQLFFNKQALGYFGLVLRYDLGWKPEENLAILVLDALRLAAQKACKKCSAAIGA